MPTLSEGKKEHIFNPMATFSLGSGITPGAPGVYINERAGVVANADIANFSTVYMLVETADTVPVTVFPFNTPVRITTLNDYLALVGGVVPDTRIPLLSYNCVNEFFQNAQVGDLRVVRVGTPDQIVEIEILPNGTKQGNSGLPTNLQAGDKVYAQLVLNGNRLVAGDGSTGYTAAGEWLGVPVTIPVSYIPGDAANNRRISAAIAAAITAAIETNPSVASSVYVRDSGLVETLDPLSNSENAYISLAAKAFDGNVSVVPTVFPVGSEYVLMQNVYDIQNIVGQQQNLERVPQDYIQCIETAFDGQQDQGYLITPTAYAQFDVAGRTAIGAAAAEHCASNSFKWMALADPGPFLITDVNKYSTYTPHEAAADLMTGFKYLVDNAMYLWTGADVTYNKLRYQALIASPTAQTAIEQSQSIAAVASGEKVGLLDSTIYTVVSTDGNSVTLDDENWWPVSYQIQEVTFSGATGTVLTALGSASGTVFVVAPPRDVAATGDYSMNVVFFAQDATSAAAVLNQVTAAGGSVNLTMPRDSIHIGVGSGTCTLTYTTPFYSLPQTINGQTSNLLQNITSGDWYVNTQHLPATLQNSTEDYRLNFVSRTIFNPDNSIAGPNPLTKVGVAQITCTAHGLVNGQKLFFSQAVTTNAGLTLFRATTKTSQSVYYVNVIDANTFRLAESLTAYTAGSFISFPTGTTSLVSAPTIFYTKTLGGQASSANLGEISVISLIRGRKYGLNSGQIASQAAAADAAAALLPSNPDISIFYNNSFNTLAIDLVSPFGEDEEANWQPSLALSNPGSSSPTLANWYCTPTVDQNYASQAFLVPSIDPIFGGDYDAAAAGSSGPVTTFGPTITGGLGGTTGTATASQVSTSGAGTGVQVSAIVTTTGTTGPIATISSGAAGVGSAVSSTGLFSQAYPAVLTTGGSGSGATINVTVTQTASVGPINSLGTVSGGSDATVGVYTGIAVTGGTGLSATVDVAVSAGPALSVTLSAAGTGYSAGDILTIPAASIGGTIDATVVVTDVIIPTAVSITTLNVPGINYTAGNTLTLPPGSIGGVVGATVIVSTITASTAVTAIASVLTGGLGYNVGDTVVFGGVNGSANFTLTVTAISSSGGITLASPYGIAAGAINGTNATQMNALPLKSRLVGVFYPVTSTGFTPDGLTPVVAGDFIGVTYDGNVYKWVVVHSGGDLSVMGQPCYGSQVALDFTSEVTPPSTLWRFDAVTSTEIINDALRGVGFNGVPQAAFIEAGVDNVNRLSADSQNYFNAFGFIAFYGPYIENASAQWIPPSPYVTGVALRRYRAEGYQFPPAGVKYQLADAIATQIPINSAQQNLLNPEGCNAIRTLPGYPTSAVFIWGGRTRVNSADAQQRLYQFVNTRVILNVVYGSLRNAFDSQIFNVIDGFGVAFNQIISVGNSVLNQLYSRGALYGSRPSEAFQVICDNRINPPASLENGIINAKVFVTPVPTLERIQIDLIRVAIGQMQTELNAQGLGTNNTGF